ncbi:zinc finger FYVE domain-containing protein 1-like isoform X3 [Convolutriloba macropyga]|uniref:zinc finger FYVE domain-containing protein 1-like isoform X3 n=1 Tax=Convolutriloba macropyga TaxID=536237 RepID=UPI003F51F178
MSRDRSASCSNGRCTNSAELLCHKCKLEICFPCSENSCNTDLLAFESCIHSFIELAPQKLSKVRLDEFLASPRTTVGFADENLRIVDEMASATAVLDPSDIHFKRSFSSDTESSNELTPQPTLACNPFHQRPNGRSPRGDNLNLSPGDFASIAIQDERSVLLLDSDERLMFPSAFELSGQLQCTENNPVKVVSIFGNTGDGKSHTLNHTFFDGKEVFKTSSSQITGTVGVWAAYDPENKSLVLDTEGLLGVTNNQNVRSRLLVKILAISDIIIYRTRSDRLHSDTFQFLGDASAAYLKYFSPELKTISENCRVSVSNLGPSLIVFHETSFTEPLKDDGDFTTAEQLKQRFSQIGRSPEGFSSISYLGVRTSAPPTDFSILREEVSNEISKTGVRSTRPLHIVFQLLQALNEKFNGPVDNLLMNTLPDEYFTCAVQCMACKSRCRHSMNHMRTGKKHSSSSRCHYQEQYQNKTFICKRCWQDGEDRVVIPKTAQSGDSVWSGLVKYAWQGYVLECPKCGVIYNSRKYWYGNKNPEEECVRVEIAHVWPDANQIFQGSHNACRQLVDGLSNVAGTISSLTARPIGYVSDWASDQVAPDYWVPNWEIKECHQCKLPFKDVSYSTTAADVCYNDQVFEEEQNSYRASEGHTNRRSSHSRSRMNNQTGQERHDSETLTRHHCRACGKGFCDSCSSYRMPVPERGWGDEAVRVCFSCYKKSSNNNNKNEDKDSAKGVVVDERAYQQVKPRIITEAVRSSVAVISSAVEIPKATVLDYTRPAYWTEDSKLTNCFCCERLFDPVKLRFHHCRCCGNGVCDPCSPHRVPVPIRGWDYPVRVCNQCFKTGVFS